MMIELEEDEEEAIIIILSHGKVEGEGASRIAYVVS